MSWWVLRKPASLVLDQMAGREELQLVRRRGGQLAAREYSRLKQLCDRVDQMRVVREEHLGEQRADDQ